MSVALQKPWTIERFLDWAERQESRYEFDGAAPVGMTGGTVNHSQIIVNLVGALRSRLRGNPCRVHGPELGLQAGSAVRFPDALITCATLAGSDRLAKEVRVVFEVLSPSSSRNDRIIKVREYASVASIRRYVLVESRFPGLLVLHRAAAGDAWAALPLTGDDTLNLPEVAVDVPVAELYEDVVFPTEEGSVS